MSDTERLLQPCALYIGSEPCASAAEALGKMPGSAGKSCILVYTPSFCGFADETLCKCVDGSDIEDADDIFEMRCFSEDIDMRWVRNGEGGVVTVLSEQEDLVSHLIEQREHKEKIEHHTEAESIHGKYILWGTGDAEGRLFEHRIGALPVPIKVEPSRRVRLNFVEYFEPDERYGNMIFLGERLTGLSST